MPANIDVVYKLIGGEDEGHPTTIDAIPVKI